MKLKTEMSNATGKWLPSVTWGDLLGAGLNHDAAAAHALMMAMEQVLTIATRDVIKQRADELMREWDFDTREDA